MSKLISGGMRGCGYFEEGYAEVHSIMVRTSVQQGLKRLMDVLGQYVGLMLDVMVAPCVEGGVCAIHFAHSDGVLSDN